MRSAEVPRAEGASDEEHRVARVLAAFRRALPAEAQDVIALATAFRDPPTEPRLLDYLTSQPVRDCCTTPGGETMSRLASGPPLAGGADRGAGRPAVAGARRTGSGFGRSRPR